MSVKRLVYHPTNSYYIKTTEGNVVHYGFIEAFIIPDKEKSTECIDGAVALIMALDRAIRNVNKASVYDERGILVL